MRNALSILAVLAACGAASGATLFATGSVSLYGNSYEVKQWRVNTDAGTTAFDPEALTFHNGVLYATADQGNSSGRGRLVQYTPGATGSLASPSFITMGNNNGVLWGPEGITVNTSGAGYGSFGPGEFKLATYDTNGAPNFGVVNVSAGGALTNVQSGPDGDDFFFSASRNQFGLILDADGSVQWLDNNLVDTGVNTPTFLDAKGGTIVSAAWVQQAFGFTSATPEVMMIVGKTTNRLAMFDTNGLALGSTQALLPVGLTMGEIEGVAVDELNNKIYLADEAALSIHVVSVPAPATGLLALAGLGLAGRRRR
jgi:hypothetical protein